MIVFSHFIYNGGFWFRLFGWGLSIANKVKNPPLFSERYGYKKVLRIGNWGIKLLYPPSAPSWDKRDADPIEDIYEAMRCLSPGYNEKKYWGLKISQHKRQKNGGVDHDL